MLVIPRNTSQSRVEDDIVKTKAEWNRASTPKEDSRTIQKQTTATTTAEGPAREEFPAGLDRSQFIYYNGDYYAPTIPGIRISKPDGKSSNPNYPLIEGPPEEMFREFRKHSKEFQKVIPLVNGARSAAEGQLRSSERPGLDIMDKTIYMKQDGTIINAPPVRIPDKRT
ncbi:unnamed protein product, partial [Strongylus vulgaris]